MVIGLGFGVIYLAVTRASVRRFAQLKNSVTAIPQRQR